MFNREIIKYVENMDIIRQYISSVEPILLERITENFKKDAYDLRLLLLIYSEMNTDGLDKFKLSDEDKNKIRGNFNGEIIKHENEDGCSYEVSGPDSEKFNLAMGNHLKLTKQKELLYRSSLMSIISTVECFMLEILRKFFKQYSQEVTAILVQKKDKHFTIDEIDSFGDIKDAKNYIINCKIEDIIRGSFESWIDFLKEKFHISMSYLDIESIIEIFQRRNIIVHNEGIVNSIYLSKVSSEYQKIYKKNSKINLDSKYLECSIDTLELSFSLIAFELWKKRVKTDDKRFELLEKIIDKNLQSNRWELVKGYSKFLSQDACCSQQLKIFAKINLWLAIKRLGDFDKIREEVESEDLSACTLNYQVCKYALLDNNEKVFSLLSIILDKGICAFDEINTWPIFDEYKNEVEYQKLSDKWMKQQ